MLANLRDGSAPRIARAAKLRFKVQINTRPASPIINPDIGFLAGSPLYHNSEVTGMTWPGENPNCKVGIDSGSVTFLADVDHKVGRADVLSQGQPGSLYRGTVLTGRD